jgi:hypothetical protein
MKIPIGVDDTNASIGIDTTVRARVALISPPGYGKTTTCRYLARIWLASSRGRCLILTPRRYEYGDLDVTSAEEPAGRKMSDQPGMLIVDEADLLEPGIVNEAVRSEHQLVIVASFGRAIADMATPNVGDPGSAVFDAVYALAHTPRLDAVPVQGRLDWPPNTIPVFLDQRRQIDFPLHKWAM